MDYSKLITAIRDGKSKELGLLYSETFEVLCRYLQTTMRANVPDAEDCAQHALLMTVERIRKDAIREPESLYSYLLQSAKNKYLRVQYENNRSNYQSDMDMYVPVEEQLSSLSSEEEQEALDKCLEKLPEPSQTFIAFWLKYPDAQAKDVAEEFRISTNNAWIKKHRIIKRLSECIQEKLKKHV